MKIIIPLVVTFGKQGGWRVISQLANFWIKNGHSVVFLSPDASEPYFPTIAEILYYDLKGNIVDKSKVSKQRNHILGPLKTRKSLKQVLNKMEADVVLATQNFTAAPVAKSKIKAKKFYYIQAYEPEFYEKGPLRYKIYKKIAEKSYSKGLVNIVNADMYRNYKEIKSDKVVFPGVDLNLFKPKEKAENKPFILGTIGRIEPYKGTKYVLEAFQKLREIYKTDIELHMAFGKEEWNKIEGVKVIIPNGDKELASYYQNIDSYICAGTVQMDAIHYPVIESFATKIALVTTGYYPSSEKNSWIVPIKDSDAIVKSVIEMMNSPEIRKQKTEIGFENIQEFSWENVSEKMLAYFHS